MGHSRIALRSIRSELIAPSSAACSDPPDTDDEADDTDEDFDDESQDEETIALDPLANPALRLAHKAAPVLHGLLSGQRELNWRPGASKNVRRWETKEMKPWDTTKAELAAGVATAQALHPNSDEDSPTLQVYAIELDQVGPNKKYETHERCM